MSLTRSTGRIGPKISSAMIGASAGDVAEDRRRDVALVFVGSAAGDDLRRCRE